jgi:coatomer subunit beta
MANSVLFSSAIIIRPADIQAVFQELRKVLGEIPILASEQVCGYLGSASYITDVLLAWKRLLDEVGDEHEPEKQDGVNASSGKPRILADGTYATETAFSSIANARLEAVKSAAKPPLRCTLCHVFC